MTTYWGSQGTCLSQVLTEPVLEYTVGSGTVVVLGRRGYGVIVRSIRSLLIEWHHFRGIVGRIDVRLPCLTGVGT